MGEGEAIVENKEDREVVFNEWEERGTDQVTLSKRGEYGWREIDVHPI